MNRNSSVDFLCMHCMSINSNEGICPICGFNENSYQPVPHHLPLRTILNGKYLIGRVLGEGGFGITYLGWDLNLDLKIAIKEYYPTGFVTRENTAANTVHPYAGEKGEFFQSGREKFVDEAKRLAKFYALPGIVSIKDFFLENSTAYIVMEYIEGQTFKQYLQSMGGKIPSAQMFEMMKPLFKSLFDIHKSGIIHRDISPDNIMITKEGYIKLLDFGAARDFADSGNKSLSVMLKPGYAPEEQYRSKGVQGPWTDIYALCATIYKAITSVTPDESNERLLNDELKRPSQLGIAIHPRQEAALMKGMSVLVQNRYQSINELSEALYQERDQERVNSLHDIKNQPLMSEANIPVQQKEHHAAMDSQQEEGLCSGTDYQKEENFYSDTDYPQEEDLYSDTAYQQEEDLNSDTAYQQEDDLYSDAGFQVENDIFLNEMNEEADLLTEKKFYFRKFKIMFLVGIIFALILFSLIYIKYHSNTSTDEEAYSTTNENEEEDSDTSDSSIKNTGNTIGNMYNQGLVVQYGDWVFFSPLSGNGTYQMKKDGSQKERISKRLCFYMSIANDWLYYCDFDRDFKLCKMKLDGTDNKVLDDSHCRYAYVVDDWIYYQIEYDGIYKIKTDGSEKTQVLKSEELVEDYGETIDNFYVYDNWIYYHKYSGNNEWQLYRMTIEGSQNTCVFAFEASWINIVDDWIYYINNSDSFIYRAKLDGSEIANISQEYCSDINVAGDWIYFKFKNQQEEWQVCKIRTDGSERTELDICTNRLILLVGDQYFHMEDWE